MLKIISSMATRLLLAEAATLWRKQSGLHIAIESVGGLDAAKRVNSGEALDGVVLARQAIDQLAGSGHVVSGSRIDLASSSVAVAVRAGVPIPDISTESALRKAVENAGSIGYSTGPSGVATIELVKRWGQDESVNLKMIQAPPGVPVGLLLARGDIALGFQQLSELMHLEGITVAGTLPEAVAITTVFSAGICRVSSRQTQAADFLAFLASTDVDDLKRRHGMTMA